MISRLPALKPEEMMKERKFIQFQNALFTPITGGIISQDPGRISTVANAIV